MTKIISRFFLIMFSIALLTACGDDSTDPNDSNNFDAFVGTWNCTEYKYISNANASLVYDFLVETGATITFRIESNGNYTASITLPGFPPQTFSGNLNSDENGDIELDSDPDIQVTINNNTLTIVDPNESWDFDNDGTNEPATARQVYTKQ